MKRSVIVVVVGGDEPQVAAAAWLFAAGSVLVASSTLFSTVVLPPVVHSACPFPPLLEARVRRIVVVAARVEIAVACAWMVEPLTDSCDPPPSMPR